MKSENMKSESENMKSDTQTAQSEGGEMRDAHMIDDAYIPADFLLGDSPSEPYTWAELLALVAHWRDLEPYDNSIPTRLRRLPDGRVVDYFWTLADTLDPTVWATHIDGV